MEGLLVQIVRIDVLLHHSEDVFIEHSAWVKLWHEDRAWEILAFAPTFTYKRCYEASGHAFERLEEIERVKFASFPNCEQCLS